MSSISKSSGVIILSLLTLIGTACKKDIVLLPTVFTSGITEISNISAISGGNAINDGGSSIVAKGVCWNTTGNPTINNIKTSDGTGTGSYISNLNALQPGTTYYVKSYATNSLGSSYGNEISFTTTQSTIAFEFKINNLTPPIDYYEIAEGSCAESILWTICQYFRLNLSQEEINKIGGNPGRGLHADEMIQVLDSLKIPYCERKKEATWECTVDSLTNIIKKGNPVILGVKIYPDKFPQWFCDHFILLTGTNTNSKLFYYNSNTQCGTITYTKLCNTEDGYSLVNKYDILFAIEIILPD